MEQAIAYRLAADAILVIHFLFVVFVVVGLLLIYTGKLRSWHWVKNPWFRLTHLIAVAIVVLQSWLGVICPLTTWEMTLRAKAGDATYTGSFIAHWLHETLFYSAPEWAFIIVYTLFGALVLASWFLVRPNTFKKH